MREIKFRAWDRVTKVMAKVTGLRTGFEGEKIEIHYIDSEINESICIANKSHIEIMQYTEFKDINGVEICEGDIVRHFESTGVIKWVKDRLLISWDENSYYREDLAFWGIKRTLEVVGNIYENRIEMF